MIIGKVEALRTAKADRDAAEAAWMSAEAGIRAASAGSAEDRIQARTTANARYRAFKAAKVVEATARWHTMVRLPVGAPAGSCCALARVSSCVCGKPSRWCPTHGLICKGDRHD